MELTQGVAYTGPALPAASRGNLPTTYTFSPAIAGLSVNSERKITGAPTSHMAKTQIAYTVTDPDDGTDTITFNMSIAPMRVAVTAVSGNGLVTLSWKAIPGVTGWEVLQTSGGVTGVWTSIAGSNDATNAHTVTGLTNATLYGFKVRALVGTGDARVDGAESTEVTGTPLSTNTNAPVIGTVPAAFFLQGVDEEWTLPLAQSGDGHPNYANTLTPALPAGLTFDAATRKIAGTPTAPTAAATFTYTVTETTAADSTPESDSKTFAIAVGPMKPANFNVTPGDTKVTLSWTAIAGVSRWYYNEAATTNWDLVQGGDATTDSYTITGLTNGTAYTFKVVAVVGVLNAEVFGVETDTVKVTPSEDNNPTLAIIPDKLYPQGVAVNETLPAATGGDGVLTYTLTPDVSGSGLAFNASTRALSGTPSAPKAKVTYTYKAAETTDDDGTNESASVTFTIGIQPMKPAGFTAAGGDREVVLAWTAIAGVDGWEYQQNGGTWRAISGGGGATSHTVTSLVNGTSYSFKVRAHVGTGNARVDGVESDAETATPADDLTPALATIADKTYTQGATVDETLPAATGGDGHPNYAYTLTPNVSTGSGLTFTASTHKLSGTPSAPKAKVTYTYTATESSDDDGTTESASRTFTIGIQPMKPAGFTATGGDTKVTLRWAANAGVDGWEVKQGSGAWTAISGSGGGANSHVITGLANGTSYTFKVRAHVGTGNAQVIGVESDARSATPLADLEPVLATVTNKTYVQGATVDETLPAATGGDSHPDYDYTLSPNVSGIGLTFTASTHKLTGTPSAPKAKVTYTYTATESSDSDGTTESASRTFTIGIQPRKPAGLTASASGDEVIALRWTAIAGVSGWQVQQGSGGWSDISGSGAGTGSHTVTGLASGTRYTFRVRAVVGSGAAQVIGVASDAASATTLADLAPSLGNVSDKVFTQGASVSLKLPSATGGDNASGYTYTLSPDVSGIGLAFDAAKNKVTGTPSSPQVSAAYTYTATEASDSDGTPESASVTFSIGVQPKKPANLRVNSDGSWATLTWDAIAGASGWQYQKDGGRWTSIDGGGGASSATVSLPNGASAAFAVRAYVGTGDARLPGLASDTVKATVVVDYDTTSAGLIYDDDGNGLIEISSLAQLQASRLDSNGDGRTDDRSMQAFYDRAFPNAAPNMGCDTRCHGYELATDDLTPGPTSRGSRVLG